MKWIECDDSDEAAARGAAILLETVSAKPDAHLVLATGESPTKAYRVFAEMGIDCRGLFITSLDEWWGMPSGSPGTCRSYLVEHAVGPWGCDPNRFLGYDSDLASPEQARDDFVASFAARPPVHLCVLGIGRNGHLGLNEPGESFSDGIHVSVLQPVTREHSMVASITVAPTLGVTLGCGDLLRCRRLLVLASSEHKQAALDAIRKGVVTPEWPCTLLLRHEDATVVTWEG